MKRLAIVTTHPIQYNAPLFQLLAERGKVEIKVFYTWSQSTDEVVDPEFGLKYSWDIPLLDGYNYAIIKNTSTQPGALHFKGIVNPDLINNINEWKPDAIMVYGWSFISHLKVLRYFNGKIPVLFRGDSHLMNEAPGFSLKKILRRIVLTRVYGNIDTALYVGEQNKRYYAAHGVKASEMIFAPHAVDNKRFSDPTGSVEAVAKTEREKLCIPDSAIVFLYAGKLFELKDLDVLINSFKSLSRRVSVRLLIVGNGKDEEKLKQLAGDDDRVIFQPFKNQSEMPLVYRLGDVFVLPSKSETWGLGVNEAMACSRPVLVSNKCGCSVDLVNIETGFVFETGNITALKKCLEAYTAAGKEGIKKMGKAAERKISEYSYEKVAIAVEGVINNLKPGRQ